MRYELFLVATALSVFALGGAALAGPVAPAAPALPPFSPDANIDRAKVPGVYKWKLAPLFQSDAEHKRGLEQTAGLRQRLEGYRGKLADPRALRECLDLYFQARLLSNKLTLYANMRLDGEQKNTALQEQNDRALGAMTQLISLAGFIRQELLALDDAAMQAAYAREPGLAGYKPYIDGLRRRRGRVLDPKAEQLLVLAGDNLWAEIDLNELPSDHEKSYRALRADLVLPKVKDEQGREVQLTMANLGKLRASAQREVRRGATEGLLGALKQYQHAFAASFSGQVRFNIMLARARGYSTALEAYLDKDNISPAVYTNLISAVRANLQPLHRYVALRKEVMGLDEVRLFDLYPPMISGVRKEVPYAEAMRILPEALAPLGAEYVRVLNEGLDPRNGWIDVFPNTDKESGAFCASVHGVHPYVKMNYQNEVDDLSTLAHEYGHALHSHLSMTTQPYVTSSYAPFIAEIASTFNEKLLFDYLVREARSDDERLHLLNELVEAIRTTIYRQTLFAEFELRAHTAAEQGTPLTAEWLNQTYAELIKTYYGPAYTMGPADDVEWAYVPHFYYKYYMFSYATGLSSGIALAELVQKKGASARDAYLGMLKGGSSKPPLELLKGAGVDLTRPQAVEAAARLLDRTLAEMEKLLASKSKQKAGKKGARR